MTELMAKVPPGYRELVGDEKESFMGIGTSMTLLQFKLAQHHAELDAAKANTELAKSRIRDAQQEMQIAMVQRDGQNKLLKLTGAKDEVVADGTHIYVIVRPEGWEPPNSAAFEPKVETPAKK
jgi:hypothetical protein